jgi:phosphoribosylformylglycinamidine synthase II
MKITPESLSQLLSQHGLTAEEFDRLRELLGRDPNLTELGIFSVMWSEHCSYKSSRVHLKQLPTGGPHVLQGPGENAGIIDIGDGWACAFKIESHNHPSYVEPFQGAATGIGGILRDVFTMGARPIAIMDSLRFGPLEPTRADGGGAATDEATAAKNQSILNGVIGGIAHYGNCFGVANLGGETMFDACYSGNPLVNAFALGIARHDQLFFGRASGVGNPVIYVGAKTGRDGIHGATMASEEFSEASEAKRPNVQVGDPFLEKLLLEACLEAMQTGAVVGIQDMGAAGLTSSSCEMGARAGTGIDLDLDRVPQRESGMSAYEMMLSESQERMLLVAERSREAEVFEVFRKWGLDAVEVGTVTDTGRLRVKHCGEVVADIPNPALTDEAPRYRRPTAKPARTAPLDARIPPALKRVFNDDLLTLLGSGDICSKAWIYEQYDTMVRTNTIEGPGGDAGVVRIKGTATALAMALDGNGRYCRLDAREGARLAVAEAARNVACAGAEPMAATNCLNFGNPEKPQVMGQFVEAIAGIAEACSALGTPITGGNVSFYNETLGQGIAPTPVVGVVGRMTLKGDRVPLTPAFQRHGRAILLLDASPALDSAVEWRRFGSSEYARAVLDRVWGLPPALDLERERKLHQLLAAAFKDALIESAHDISDGGLAVCVAECILARPVEVTERAPIGASLELRSETDARLLLFGESAGRVVVSCAPESIAAVRQLGQDYGITVVELGVTGGEGLSVALNGESCIRLRIAEIEDVWRHSLARMLAGDAVAAV